MKLTISVILNCTIQGHLLRAHCCVTAISTYFQNISITPEENPAPIKQLLFIPPTSPPLPNTNLHSVTMDLPILDASYKWNHIIRDFWVWLLSLSMASRFIQTVAYISFFPFLWLSNILLYGYTASCLSTDWLMDVGVVALFFILTLFLLYFLTVYYFFKQNFKIKFLLDNECEPPKRQDEHTRVDSLKS